MEKDLSRRGFVTAAAAATAAMAGTALVGCSSSSSSSAAASSAAASSAAASSASASAEASASAAASGSAEAAASIDQLTMIWLPSESTADYENMRDIFNDSIAAGAGIPCVTETTTDMNVVVEAITNGTVNYAYLGASEYVNAHAKNPAVLPAWVLSDKEGNLNKVTYHSQVLAREADAENYKVGDTYELGDITGKDYAFVSLGSTSGFVLPAMIYANQYDLPGGTDDVAESGKFLGTVTLAGTHALSLYTLLSGDAELCTCDDTGTSNYYDVVEGANGEVGAVYAVKEGLDSPFDKLAGERVVVVASFPAPGAPFCVNMDSTPADINDKVVAYMCSEAVSGNPQLFTDPDDTTTVSKWKQSTGKVSFVPLDDAYFDDFREMLGLK